MRRSQWRLPNSALGRAIRHFDVEEFLSNAGVDVEQHGTQLSGECPLCHHYRTSFYINPDTKWWKCHMCGEGGGLLKLVSEVLDEPYDDAFERVLEGNAWADFDQPEEEEEDEEPVVIQLPPEFELLKKRTLGTRRFWRYAESRGIDKALAKRYKVGFCRTGDYRGRLIIPVYRLGVLEMFVARDITNNALIKVRTPDGNNQHEQLFNLEQVWGRKMVVVVEGVFDALAMPDKAVATFGKKMSRRQAELLQQAGVETVVFCWDNDALSDQARYAATLESFFTVLAARLPEGMDPASAPPEALRRAVANAGAPRLADRVRRKWKH